MTETTRTFYAAYDCDAAFAVATGQHRTVYDRRVILDLVRSLLKRKREQRDVFEGLTAIDEALAAHKLTESPVNPVVYSFTIEREAIAVARYKAKLVVTHDSPMWALFINRCHPLSTV